MSRRISCIRGSPKSTSAPPEIRDFLAQSNPWALHAIAERLLEAAERGLWREPDAATLDMLRRTLLDAETLVEARGERVREGRR